MYVPKKATKLKSMKIDDVTFSLVSAVDDAFVKNSSAVYLNPFKDQITLQNVKDGDFVKVYYGN